MGDLMSWKLLIAIGLLGLGLFIRGYGLYKRSVHKDGHQTLDDLIPEDIDQLRAPFRSSEDYRQATETLEDSFSNGHVDVKQGQTVISGFAGAAQYVWDGHYLSVYAGQHLLKVEGHHISDVGGNKKFTWSKDCLSKFAGKKILTVSDGIVSLVGKGPLYRYDENSISEFGGTKVLSMNGDIEVPAEIVGVLVIMLRNFTDVDE